MASIFQDLRVRIKRILILIIIGIIVFLFYLVYRASHYPMIDVRINNIENSLYRFALFAPQVDDLGLNLQRLSKIYLMNTDGQIVYSWQVLGSVQLAKLKPNGNLLYSTRDRSFRKRAGVREIDPFGNVIWYYQCWADHDFYYLKNGNILIHYIEDKPAPEIGPNKIRLPRIIEVNQKKEVVWEWRSEEHLDELTKLLGIEFPLDKKGRRLFDWAHNNSCQVIEENKTGLKDSRFRPGNIIFSYCNLNVIGIIDRKTGEIVWAWGPGELDGQHNPTMMENGNILIFDNGTDRGYSRVVKLNPLSGEIVWEYNDKSSPKPEFYSRFLSGVQPLPNGNVVICQSSYSEDTLIEKFYSRMIRYLFGRKKRSSRLFEINRSKEIIWECIINSTCKDPLAVYQATRYSNRYIRPLLEIQREFANKDKRRLKSLPYIR